MKKYNLHSSLLIDALLSLSIITSLCLFYFPMLNHMLHQLNHQQNRIEMKRILMSTLVKNPKTNGNSTFNIYRYQITGLNGKYCIIDKESHDEICISQKNK
ncbi:hypothetical protein BUZ11_13800 [Staphylococcus gallinarum]|jgi:hypothetical protein|nr:hypothetical protein BUY96_13680 [Staphylococcus gallinarum]PTK88391.1 hypothetical protein BUZ03_13445 [Staphylococcus gallinarum]PTL13960.1 hypothetical protein BUZ08_13435 [Staphylococcus gallinarum]RIO73866.1 hypothetical protein BUZ12_13480 [Staphylococcus gallinarum]RIO75990.1 hypothetical protein BUZ07_13830 [Staphylococcus gallinarum]